MRRITFVITLIYLFRVKSLGSALKETAMTSDGESSNAHARNGGRSNDQFPKTLRDFGYEFNEQGQLRQLDVPEAGFVFEVKREKEYNQRRYEALGEVITEEIYKLLETRTGLKRIYIPIDADNREARGFFFASDNAWETDRLFILIHGSGAVRAGQWSRRLIINENVNTGSQLPYVECALESGFGVVVLNTNLNRALDGEGEEVHIRGSEEPSSHALYVWDNFIQGAAARHIAIVAHSAGGYVTVNLAHERWKNFGERVFAVAFTDSVHSPKPNSPSWDHMLEVSRNWVTSRLELGKRMKRLLNDVERVSAGTLSHEMTSPSAIDDIKKYILHRYEIVAGIAEKKKAAQIDAATVESESHPASARTDDGDDVKVDDAVVPEANQFASASDGDSMDVTDKAESGGKTDRLTATTLDGDGIEVNLASTEHDTNNGFVGDKKEL